MNVADAIRARRSVKVFTGRAIPREVIESLLDLAVMAPNHRMTEPWGFVVLGPVARRAYGEIRGRAKAASLEDRSAAEAVVRKVADETEAIPTIVAFTQRQDSRLDVREEDYAAVYMAVQNFLLGAAAGGLATHVKTGPEIDAPVTRAALAIPDGERIVAFVHVGESTEARPPKPRTAARDRTRWLP